MTYPRTAVVHATLALGIALASTTAMADCSAVIAAYKKAEANGRYAIYDVNGLAAPAKGDPFAITVGGKLWISPMMDGKYRRNGGDQSAIEAAMLKDSEKDGKKRCEELPIKKIGDEAVTGWQIMDASKPKDPYAIHFYVSSATGLPIWHGMGSTSGFRWVYGAVVNPPADSKIIK